MTSPPKRLRRLPSACRWGRVRGLGRLGWALVLLAGLAEAAVAGPGGALPAPGGVAASEPAALAPVQRWMQAMHDEWAVPRYQRLDQRAQALAGAVARVCLAAGHETAAGTPAQSVPHLPAALSQARQAWLDTMRVWRQLEALQLGPTLARRTSKTIDFWPTRPSVIDKAAQMTGSLPVRGPEAEQAMQQWGTAAKGLPALEWLLFAAEPPDGTAKPAVPGRSGTGPAAPLLRSAAHCRYGQRISLALAGETADLLVAWRNEAERWRSHRPPPVQRALSDTVNLFIGSIELLRGKKLAKGAEMQARSGAGPAAPGASRLDAFDSLRSGATRELLWLHYDALAQLLLGRTAGLDFTRDGPALGLDDVLVQLGRPSQAAALAPALQRTRRVLRALPQQAQRWTPPAVRRAAAALAELRGAIDPAVAQALNVTVTFTDADGD